MKKTGAELQVVKLTNMLETLNVSDDLEVQGLHTIDDERMLYDIKFIKDLESNHSQLSRDFNSDIKQEKYGYPDKILDETFPSLFSKMEKFDPSTLWKDRGLELRDVQRGFAAWDVRREDFLFLWLADSIYCSKQMQLAMKNSSITIGNLRSQWKAEMMNRMRQRCTTSSVAEC